MSTDTREEKLSDLLYWLYSAKDRQERVGLLKEVTAKFTGLESQLAQLTRERDALRDALEDFMSTGGPACDCGHPSCKACRATIEARAALAMGKASE